MILHDKTKTRESQSFHVKRVHNEELQTVVGIRPVMEALQSNATIDKLLIQSNADGQLMRELRSLAKERGVPVQFVPVEKLNKMTTANHQGVVATVSPIKYHSFADMLQHVQHDGRVPFAIMLDHVTDVRNLGAIVRTAECAGVDFVVIPQQGSARINEDAIKSSSGAMLRLPICREANLKTAVNFAIQSGVQICAATEKGSVNYLDVDFRKPTLLIMGAEDKGVSPEVLKLAHVRASLPVMGHVQSLNVSAAAAVFVYEVLRQRT